MPRIFYVNWFRRDADGHFVWPGFGENSRVLKWVVERIEGQAAAVETPIGHVPTLDALDTDGLDMSQEDLEECLRVDVGGVEEGDPADPGVVREVRRRPAGHALDRAGRTEGPPGHVSPARDIPDGGSRHRSRWGGPPSGIMSPMNDSSPPGPHERDLVEGEGTAVYETAISHGWIEGSDPAYAAGTGKRAALELLVGPGPAPSRAGRQPLPAGGPHRRQRPAGGADVAVGQRAAGRVGPVERDLRSTGPVLPQLTAVDAALDHRDPRVRQHQRLHRRPAQRVPLGAAHRAAARQPQRLTDGPGRVARHPGPPPGHLDAHALPALGPAERGDPGVRRRGRRTAAPRCAPSTSSSSGC